MEIEKLKNYKLNEHAVFSDADKKHVENYKQLIRFFESALQDSINDTAVNYKKLHNSCIQCIRFLDNLIFTYDSAVQGVRMVNATLEKIETDNKPKTKVGNDQNYQSPL